MRNSLVGVVSVAMFLAACGGFGSEDEDKKPEEQQQQPPPSTPAENSVPPVPGKPVNGIFVSASKGRAGATGFVGSPLNTIKDGLARAKETKLQLIVCAEEYAESVEWIDGVSAYGYFDCSGATFVQVEGRRAIVKSPTSPALRVHDITVPTRIEGFEIVGPDLETTIASDTAGSSVGLELRKIAPNALIIGNSVVRSGRAAPGAEGTPPVAPTPSGTADGTAGIDQSSSNCTPQMLQCALMTVPGPKGATATCGDEPSPGPGGDGGDGLWFIDWKPEPMAHNIQHGRPFSLISQTAMGAAPCGPDNNGDDCGHGLTGSPGGNGTDGQVSAWKLTPEGSFVAGSGTRGGSGKPGQGGGGGGGSLGWFYGAGYYLEPPPGGTGYFRSARGGAGAAGGCGGLAGGGGSGGAASIAVLALDAPATFDKVAIESGEGGQGGAGTLGGAGSGGGTGGSKIGGAGRGGDGGRGGYGGSSAHGTSGPSIALAYFGARPLVEAQLLKPGAGGKAREALFLAASGKSVAATPVGDSLPELEIKP